MLLGTTTVSEAYIPFFPDYFSMIEGGKNRSPAVNSSAAFVLSTTSTSEQDSITLDPLEF
jgi:hypothetical protein